MATVIIIEDMPSSDPNKPFKRAQAWSCANCLMVAANGDDSDYL